VSEDLEIFLEDFADFLNHLEASITKMKVQVEKLIGANKKREAKE